jgi:hypothetical protein
MRESYIRVTLHDNNLTTYEWVGSKYGRVHINVRFFSERRHLMPWPLKVTRATDFGMSYEVVRKDVGWHLWWRLVYLHRLMFCNIHWLKFKWKIIKTLEIWGFAYQPEAEVISWKNIGRKRSN